ncbi:MoaD/ThiS family protein [bacterium]|nr:MoaD/ThiS family protein [bacterium]
MPNVKFTSNLEEFFPHSEVNLNSTNLLELILSLDEIRPRFSTYLLEDNHNLRQHVNIFIDGVMHPNRENLDIEIPFESEVYVMQALSGG